MGGVGARGIVIGQPFSDPGACLRSSFKCVQVDAFIFQGPPEPLNHAIVNPATFAIHGYFHIHIFQRLRPFKAGKLATLVAVHDLGLAIFGDGFFQGFDTKIRLHAV